MFVWLVDEFVDDKVTKPPLGAAEFVGESKSADDTMALSLSCEPPGADAIDFVSNSWVVGIFNGIGRDGEFTADEEAGGGAVAGGMSTGAGCGTAICSCIGSTARGGCKPGRGDATGEFVIVGADDGAVMLPTCPQTATGARNAAVNAPMNCRAPIIISCQITGEHQTCPVLVRNWSAT